MPPEETVTFDTAGSPPPGDDAKRRRQLLAVLGSALAAIAIAGAMWLSSFGSNGRESGLVARRDTVAPEAGTRTTASETPTASAEETVPDSAEERAPTDPTPPAVAPAPHSAPAPDPDPPARVGASPQPPPTPAPAPPPGPQVEELLADAAAAEAAGDLDAALAVFDAVLRRETDNRRALTGRERVQAAKIRTTVEDNLRAANAAFAAGRYEDARRLFQDAFDLDAAPAAAEGLRRVDNLEAVLCPDDATYGTLVMRVRPVAEIFVDERSLGMATVLALRVSAGRHRIRLETAEWRFPRALEIAAGATSEVEVDLEQDGFPR